MKKHYERLRKSELDHTASDSTYTETSKGTGDADTTKRICVAKLIAFHLDLNSRTYTPVTLVTCYRSYGLLAVVIVITLLLMEVRGDQRRPIAKPQSTRVPRSPTTPRGTGTNGGTGPATLRRQQSSRSNERLKARKHKKRARPDNLRIQGPPCPLTLSVDEAIAVVLSGAAVVIRSLPSLAGTS
ncbi:hypothetical protein CHU98_g8923 [Xylaria longipes]|nr:hypothetical protein CHU98_g8923 [Xylaria longipes]